MNAPFRPAEQNAAASLTAYRPFIDGLRAVSILAVVLYHVGVPGISGGYVGVDVFFVISGFLIISQIVEGLRRGTFSFGDFWARRALRILPPYLLVVGFTIAVAPLVLILPDELREFSRQVRDAALMIVNHLFLSQQGYFDAASDTKPLLHLWSLAVEEQFYVLAPCLLALVWWLPDWLQRPALRSKLLPWAALVVFAGSLIGCILLTSAGGRNYAFYLTALRAWEFVAGGAVGFFLPAARRLPRRSQAWLAAAGLAAILIAVVVYRSGTLYPSWRATLPVFGAAMVILAGLADPKAPAIRLLASPPMVWIGLVSYSWYLWHWPLLAMSRIWNFGEPDFATDLGLGALSLGLAAATYYLLERPIRRWRQGRRKRPGWRFVFTGVCVCVAGAIGGYQAMQAFARQSAASIASGYQPKSTAAASFCDLMSGSSKECLALAQGRPIGVLIGDSQMLAARNVLATRAAESSAFAASVASPGCVAMLTVTAFLDDRKMVSDCAAGKENALAQLTPGTIEPAYAILFSQWHWYGHPYKNLGTGDAAEPAADQEQVFIAGLRGTIEKLRSIGVRRTLIVGPTPLFPRLVPSCLYRADSAGMDRAEKCGVERSAADKIAAPAWKQIEAAVADFPDVRYVDPFTDFCDASRCLPYAGGLVLFSDNSHVSDAGIERIIAGHRADFDWVFGRGPL